jgi:hypothetical protein
MSIDSSLNYADANGKAPLVKIVIKGLESARRKSTCHQFLPQDGQAASGVENSQALVVGLAVRFHRDDDISLFVSCVNKSVSFGSLF